MNKFSKKAFWISKNFKSKSKRFKISAVIILLTAIIGVSFYLYSNQYEVLFCDLNETNLQKLVYALNDKKVNFKINENRNTIMVPKDQVNRLRIRLAYVINPEIERPYWIEGDENLKNNKDADKSTLKSEEDIKERIAKQQIKGYRLCIRSIDMKTWDEYIKKYNLSHRHGISSYHIESDHLVWVVIEECTDELNNNTIKSISVFDSVTGLPIMSITTNIDSENKEVN